MAERLDDNLTILRQPRLREPTLVAGFAGWLDGGGAAMGTLEYLIKKLKATRFAQIHAENFHVYQVPGMEMMRPLIKTAEGLVEIIHTPVNDFFYWKNPRTGAGDVILLLGTEPNMRWNEYIGALLNFAEKMKVKRIYSVGGVLGGVPHTRQPQVSCSVSHPELKKALAPYAVRFSNYTGPGTFQSYLVAICHKFHMPAIHLTARAVYYPEFSIGISFNPKAIHALLQRLTRLLDMDLDVSDLVQAGLELEAKLNSMAKQNPKLQSYVEELERNYTELKLEEGPLKGQPEDFVRDAEEYLRRTRETGDS